ncbi:hypothetical protein DFH07DRAFT_782429 [Mycena maculata]|uniref:Uncharacterized protein n=1 Tax=Mycena maculata TaxID=230809 RepID=A0AAD7MPZ0_9AGAR|nr:hypothetical protein DFH07DRAFT_782429 [Mycena maculata]
MSDKNRATRTEVLIGKYDKRERSPRSKPVNCGDIGEEKYPGVWVACQIPGAPREYEQIWEEEGTWRRHINLSGALQQGYLNDETLLPRRIVTQCVQSGIGERATGLPKPPAVHWIQMVGIGSPVPGTNALDCHGKEEVSPFVLSGDVSTTPDPESDSSAKAKELRQSRSSLALVIPAIDERQLSA